MSIYNSTLVEAVRRLLRNNPTRCERLLWNRLRRKQLGHLFRRQYSIGNYVVDFYCPSKRLVVELDGGQNNDKTTIEYDKQRTKSFEELGIRVMRFWNSEVVKNIDEIVEAIYRIIVGKTLTPPSKIEGGREGV